MCVSVCACEFVCVGVCVSCVRVSCACVCVCERTRSCACRGGGDQGDDMPSCTWKVSDKLWSFWVRMATMMPGPIATSRVNVTRTHTGTCRPRTHGHETHLLKLRVHLLLRGTQAEWVGALGTPQAAACQHRRAWPRQGGPATAGMRSTA